jgi:hypothetical protein
LFSETGRAGEKGEKLGDARARGARRSGVRMERIAEVGGWRFNWCIGCALALGNVGGEWIDRWMGVEDLVNTVSLRIRAGARLGVVLLARAANYGQRQCAGG